CKSLPSNTRLYKKIAAMGGTIACDAVKPHAVGGWLTARCRDEYGLQIEPKAAALLTHMVGNDLGRLDGELQKLAIYLGDRKRIDAADVEALVGHQREEEIWGIMSAMAAGDEARALSLWEEVYQTDRAAEARSVAGLA